MTQLLLLGCSHRDHCSLVSFRLKDRGLLGCFGAHDGGLSFRVGRLNDRGFQFLLLARDFLLLDRDQFLGARTLDLHLLPDNSLLGRCLSERPGLRSLRLLGLDFGRILRLANGEVTLGLGDLSVSSILGFFTCLQRLRRLDFRVAGRLCFADGRIALDLGRAPFAKGIEVTFFVAYLLNGQHVHTKTHLLQIVGGFARQFLGKTLAVVIDFFDGEGAEDRAQVAFKGLKNDPLHLIRSHSEESFGGGLQGSIITADLDVSHGLDEYRHALQCVSSLDL